jgi:hypothetical protein
LLEKIRNEDYFFDKTLLFDGRSIGGLFFLVKGYFASILRRKPVAGDAIGGWRWIGDRSFEKSSHLLVKSPDKMSFLSTIQTNLSDTPFSMRRYAWI